MKTIDEIRRSIEPFRQQITGHKVYRIIKDPEDLQIFIQHHVYAVWDFMSLLKTLQNSLTCTTVPWFPKGYATTRYLINEIVAGEESDLDPDGNRMSHYELYLKAMQTCGTDTSSIESFTKTLQQTGDIEMAYRAAGTPVAAINFVNATFETIHSQKDHLQSAVFTFGREDLIPGMFISLVNDIHINFPGTVSLFKYYLERHIEVDGDHHSQLALEMTSQLCGNDDHKWQEAEQACIVSLQHRISLWDAVYNAIMENRKSAAARPLTPVI